MKSTHPSTHARFKVIPLAHHHSNDTRCLLSENTTPRLLSAPQQPPRPPWGCTFEASIPCFASRYPASRGISLAPGIMSCATRVRNEQRIGEQSEPLIRQTFRRLGIKFSFVSRGPKAPLLVYTQRCDQSIHQPLHRYTI